MNTDPRVQAIRNHPLVGNGSCTTIDEAMEDSELIQALDENEITTPETAVKWAIDQESLQVENATNKRWGEDSDPEIRHQREWNQRKSEYE